MVGRVRSPPRPYTRPGNAVFVSPLDHGFACRSDWVSIVLVSIEAQTEGNSNARLGVRDEGDGAGHGD